MGHNLVTLKWLKLVKSGGQGREKHDIFLHFLIKISMAVPGCLYRHRSVVQLEVGYYNTPSCVLTPWVFFGYPWSLIVYMNSWIVYFLYAKYDCQNVDGYCIKAINQFIWYNLKSPQF